MQQQYRFKIDKLVRDKIPDVIKQKGIKVIAKVLEKQQYASALKSKLLEEAEELNQAQNHNQALEELCDVLEVMLAIANLYNICLADIISQMEKKRAKLGGFKEAIYLDYIEVDDSNAHLEYYQKRSLK
jgi:predicted house-cleaning noncanonical NTP pyrophosphatase (MazG superfamily)